VTLTHLQPTVIFLSGNHSLSEGDYVVFVPADDGSCANAATAGPLSGGRLDANLSVTVQLGGGFGTIKDYRLCVAPEPTGGFPGGHPGPQDFEYHPQVSVIVMTSTPPPLVPPPPPPLTPTFSGSTEIGQALTTPVDSSSAWFWVAVCGIVLAIIIICFCCWFVLPAYHRWTERQLDKPLGLYWRAIGSVAPNRGEELRDEKLARALAEKTEFTRDEWESFGIARVYLHTFIKSDAAYFKPTVDKPAACTPPAPEVRVSNM